MASPVAVLLLATGCGRIAFDPVGGGSGGVVTTDDNGGAQSGTRLKLMWQTFADGTRKIDYYAFDSQRGERCVINPTVGDGELACVPEGMQSAYRDAACTQLVGFPYVGSGPSATSRPEPCRAA
jgi:hypothetical protein